MATSPAVFSISSVHFLAEQLPQMRWKSSSRWPRSHSSPPVLNSWIFLAFVHVPAHAAASRDP
eukprot:3848198-Pyramimonas_sp.AAC.2